MPGSLDRCIRVLIHWNTSRSASEIVHVYTRGATTLRPERAVLPQRVVSSTEIRE